MSPEPPLGVITIIASAIVFIGWLVVAGVSAGLVRWRVGVIREEAGGTLPRPEGMAWAFYLLGMAFWPASFIAGAYFMTKPETTLQGRNCLYIGIAYLTIITGLTCAGMVAVGLWAPDLLAPLMP
jgi:hypothetical protein